MFPSQAPRFISISILNRSWELLRVLFFGILVSYVLLSRRNAEMCRGIHSKIDSSPSSYLPKFFHEEESEDPTGFDETNTFQTWNSGYLHGQTRVVVPDANCVLDGRNSPSLSIDNNKPLNLPIRSLRPRIIDPDRIDSTSGTGSMLDLTGDTTNISKNQSLRSEVIEHRRTYSVNGSGSSIDLKSSSGRPSHTRSKSLRSTVRNSHSTESIHRSSSNIGSSSDSKVSLNNSSTAKNQQCHGLNSLSLEEKTQENVSLPSPVRWHSRSQRMEMREESESQPLKSRSFRSLKVKIVEADSTKSFSGRGSTSNFKQSYDSCSKPRNWKVCCLEPLTLDEELKESADLSHHVKASSAKGKSVRTVRASDQRRVELTGGNPINNSISYSQSNKNKKRAFVENVIVETEEESESEDGKFQVSSDDQEEEEAVPNNVTDAEVDKKADEFIAKFKEHIRLQKLHH